MDLLDTILRGFRNLLKMFPLSVRRFIVKTTLMLPLPLVRFVSNLGTSPLGDERKWIHKIEKKTWKGVWIVPNLNSLEQAEDVALNSDLVVFYVHGGGYFNGDSAMYMDTYQLIINHLRNEHNIRASILSLEYSLSPEHVWPTAREEAMESYQYLTNTIGIPSSKIIFAGDSAGGNLVAVMILTIKNDKHRSQPAGAALFSPWIDLTINQPSFALYPNDYLSSERLEKCAGYFIPDFKNLSEASRLAMIQNPQISPFFGDFSKTCPMFISYGDIELLRTSIENFNLNLEKDGVSVTTLIGQNELHIWIVYSFVASCKETFEKDCKIFINWMASITTGSSNVASVEVTSIGDASEM